VFVTEVSQGQVFQSYVPTPVWPRFDLATRRRFERVDQVIATTSVAMVDPSEVVSVIVQDRVDAAERTPGVRQALAWMAGCERMRRSDFFRLNSHVVGFETSTFRKTPVWMGGPTPATAWHVGSPAGQLDRLCDDVLRLSQTGDLPTSLRALVALMRILQVHPFRDGNGRSARLYAWWLLRRRFGESPMALRLLAALWHRGQFDLHAASVPIRNDEDWSLLFQRVVEVVDCH